MKQTVGKFAISAGHEATLQTAKEILEAGGNAADAAIGAFLTSWVAEPCMSSAGGGAFALVKPYRKKPVLFDFFCQTPATKQAEAELDFRAIEVDFGDGTDTFHAGLGSTAVPGAAAGVLKLHHRYGSMPLRELALPAMTLAEVGVPINNFQYLDFTLLTQIIALSERGKSLYFRNGTIKTPGAFLAFPQMVDYLNELATEKIDPLLSDLSWLDDYEQGGHLRREDFENYKVKIRSPLEVPLGEYTLFTNPLPSIGGTLVGKMLHHHRQDGMGWIKSQQAANAWDRSSHWPAQKRGNTTHFSIQDAKGNAVSLTSTNGEGCGYFVPGTDIQLNNMLGEAALLPGGFHSWQPNTRLSSMMSPSMLCDRNGDVVFIGGTGGAGRIASAMAQSIDHWIDHQDLAAAVALGRIHLEGGIVHAEPDAPAFEVPSIFELQQWQEQSLFFGGVNAIATEAGTLRAAADSRREGSAWVG